MGRAATAHRDGGRPSRHPGPICRRSDSLRARTNRRSSPRASSNWPGTVTGCGRAARATDASKKHSPEQEVVLHELWFQLSLPDRQCFGHRFSGMVLKALGLRPCPAQEVEA